MKKNDSGDFSVIYVEPGDDKASLFSVIAGQKKPVVIMLAEQAHVFQRPDAFSTLKHVKRQLNLPVVFVIPNSGHLAQQAARNGFPVYLSMDALADALRTGQLVRPRAASRPTVPLHPSSPLSPGASSEQDQAVAVKPLSPAQQAASNPGHVGQTSPVAEQHTPPAGIVRLPGDVRQQRLHRGAAPVQMNPSSPRKTIPLSPQEEAHLLPRQPSAPPVLPTAPAPRPLPVRSQGRRLPLLLVILTVSLIVAGLGVLLVQGQGLTLSSTTTAGPTIYGHVSFTSSEQLSETSSQGIEDQVVVDLDHMANPAPHKKYYAWLLGDKSLSDQKTLALGSLPVSNGHAHLFFAGDGAHTNLLQTLSRFLVTEEDATVPPISPTPDQNAWRYYAEFSTTPLSGPDNPNHFSYLDHLRHLLAADPTLDELELPGGLNNWFYRNSGKIVEWTSSVREQWEETKDVGYVRRATTRVLQYLDGTSFIYLDLPAGTPLLVNERLARVGMLTVAGQDQQPPSYLEHIVHHLNGLLQAGKATPALRKNSADLLAALNNAQFWLTKVRQDSQQILKMSDEQLRQPDTLMLLNDLIDNANLAYTGQLDPNTNTMREGVVWLHDHMQELASLDVTSFQAGNNASHQMMPGTPRPQAVTPSERKHDGPQSII